MSELTIRPAFPADAETLQRLAELDSSAVPAGALLIAELDGEVAAALCVHSGAVIADPFRPTVALVQLLERRAEQLRGDGRRERRRLLPRSRRRGLRAAPAP